MKNSWFGVPFAVLFLAIVFVVVPLAPSIAFGVLVHFSDRPETGPQPSTAQLIAVAERHRAALDDLLRMRREHRIGSIDVQTSTYRPYCASECGQSPPIHFDSTREPWKRYVGDLHDLRALSVASGYELEVIVWEGGGWRDLPQKGYSWTDRPKHECVVSDSEFEKWETCSVAYRPIGRNWYLFRD